MVLPTFPPSVQEDEVAVVVAVCGISMQATPVRNKYENWHFHDLQAGR